MFGRKREEPEAPETYRLSVGLSVRGDRGGSYLNVNEEFRVGPLTVLQLGELLQKIGENRRRAGGMTVVRETGPLLEWCCPYCGEVFKVGFLGPVWDVKHPEFGKPCAHFQGILSGPSGTRACWVERIER